MPEIRAEQTEFVRLVYYLELVTEGMDWNRFNAAVALNWAWSDPSAISATVASSSTTVATLDPQSPEELEREGQRTVGVPGDADRRAVLGQVLRRLDEKTRHIGILHFLDGLTQEEVAAETGFSRKTIGKKLQAFEENFLVLWRNATGETT